MKDKGTALMGIGVAEGPNRAIEAAREAIRSPLLETSINGATDAIVNITSNYQASLYEIDEIIAEVHKASTTDINVIYGSAINSDLGDELVVTVIATGFSTDPVFKDEVLPPKIQSHNEPPKKEEVEVDIPEKKQSKFFRKNKKKEAIEKQKAVEEENDDIKIPSWLKDRFNK
jgi:cell division protein FtsZ